MVSALVCGTGDEGSNPSSHPFASFLLQLALAGRGGTGDEGSNPSSHPLETATPILDAVAMFLIGLIGEG